MYYYYDIATGDYRGCGNEATAPAGCTTSTDAPVFPGPTDAEIQLELTNAVQMHLDATACERNYDGILSLCTYATSTNPTFAAEGQAGVTWRDAVWAKCYQVLAGCLAGTRTTPTEIELIAELPVMVWP